MPTTKSYRSAIFAIPTLLLLCGLPVFAATLTVTNTDDSGSGSLRAAITTANGSSGDTIRFAPGVTGTITLQSALPQINVNMTIAGPGAAELAISGNHEYQVFYVNAGIVAISGLTIEYGNGTYG